VPSIINGLFAGRSGISSHGTAIAVVGDNISNSSTIGFKAARAEFEDLIAGGQTAGRVVGSGSSVSAVSPIFEQGTLELTSRPLDLAIDGNGYFALANGAERFYTRAGNFKIDSAGFIVNPNGLAVLGFPAGGTGALEPINVNAIAQDSVATTEVALAGNLDAAAPVLSGGAAAIPAVSPVGTTTSTTTYAELNAVADFSNTVQIFDSLGAKHSLTFFFFHTSPTQYVVRGYVNSEEVDPTGTATGLPRLVGSADLNFNGDGTRANPPAVGSADFDEVNINWTGASADSTLSVTFSPYTQFSASSNVLSVTQDGQGIGTVTSLSIGKDGQVSALLDNGQSATIGTVGLVNFANPEGLVRTGKNLLQQSRDSGEPIVGRPTTGTFGAVQSGSVELSTVDIANEFVKLITLQRGFQANSRIITTINQLLNDIIQLA
jgi:flagellar hook protein FlgE